MPVQFELSLRSLIGLHRDGKAKQIAWESRPPPRIDGYTVGLNASDPSSQLRHGGERHPDADEVLFLLSGRLEVHLEAEDGSGPSVKSHLARQSSSHRASGTVFERLKPVDS